MSEAVLRNALLKQVDNGAFEPKVLKREKVKEVLLSFRRSLIEKSRSECRKSSLTTFEYSVSWNFFSDKGYKHRHSSVFQ